MKAFTPTTESHGFRPDLLWLGLRPGLPAIALAQARRAGCRATKSRCSRSESAKLSGAKGRSTWRLSTGLSARRKADLPWGSTDVMDNDWFAYVTLLKQDCPKARGSRRKAIRSNWAKARMGEWNKGGTCPFDLF